jgi:hypothetical protein
MTCKVLFDTNFFELFYEHLVRYNFSSILRELIPYSSLYNHPKTHTINSQDHNWRNSRYTPSPARSWGTSAHVSVAIIVLADASIAFADTVLYVTGGPISFRRARVAGIILFIVSLIDFCGKLPTCMSKLVECRKCSSWNLLSLWKVEHPCSSLFDGILTLGSRTSWKAWTMRVGRAFREACSHYGCHGGRWNPSHTSIVKG